MSIRWLVLVAAPPFLALAAVAELARASPPRVSATDECADTRALEQAVAAHVGRPVALAGVTLSIRRDAGAWQARLSTESGARQLEAESCAAALDAAALVLALAVEPEPATVAKASGVARARPAPSAPFPGADGRAPNVGSTSDDAAWLGLGAGVLGEVGVLPAPSLGARLAIGVGWRAWRVELAGLSLLPRRAELANDAALSAQISWWAAQLSACRSVLGGFEACAGSELGELRGEGSGVDAPRAARGTWFAETLATVWTSPWPRPSGPWSWQLGSSLALAVVRPEFGFDEFGVLHRPSPVSGRLWLAIDWR